ncbi:restriction endonuclease [Desulfallas sp. Bu1-1]|uniref:restriction endonuclease n=1 Tax=Desulfallas sp. Bu1-1 TaxID=2787620 RepID=UPI00189D5002|nr:restriction endonuclease [Desulfallas sp. Bu1-1]MBF7084125.1 restriction endonuclease [Desulfallas sp. Bu1-1]
MFNDKLHHFIQNPPRDNRTRPARAIDFTLSLILVWFVTIFAAGLLPLESAMLNALLIIVLVIETALMIKLKFYRQKMLNLHRDTWFSARKCREKLKSIESRQEFIAIVKDLLESNPAFKDLKILSPCGDSNIDLSGKLHNQKVGVMCVNPTRDDHKVSMEQVRKFWCEIRESGFDRGIILTTGSFSDDARRFARRINGKTGIHLVDGYNVLRMAKRSGHPVFPDEKWREEGGTDISGIGIALSIKENILNSRKKALLFIILGVVFLAISALQAGFVGPIYLISGIINLFTGFSGYILSFLRNKDLLFDLD